MKIKKNISLKPYNTFGIDVNAKFFCEINSVDELRSCLSDKEYINEKKLILGGGSNLLFTSDFDGMIIKIALDGIEVTEENNEFIKIKAGAGVNWHQFVLHCIKNNWGGIENLSLIPGTVGAAPMQNIGAYGVEIKEVFESLEAMKIKNGEIRSFNKEQCEFGYRNSIFKNKVKDQYIICSVTLRLNKKHEYNISYGAIKNTLEKSDRKELSIKAISDAVISIRSGKLPDPGRIGNAGSFFKNPTVNLKDFENLKNRFTDIPGYELPDNTVKVPAAWLIEKSGWKGKRIGQIGVHDKQALVLVNYGNGKGEDLKKLAFDIRTSVAEKFGITLTPEVNIV